MTAASTWRRRWHSKVALAWLRQRQLAQVIPIIGARTLNQLEDNAGCLHVTLDDDALTRLNDISAVQLGFPHDFLATTRDATYGGMFDRIDRRRDRGVPGIV